MKKRVYPPEWQDLLDFSNDAFIRMNKDIIGKTPEYQEELKEAFDDYTERVSNEMRAELMQSESFRKEVEKQLEERLVEENLQKAFLKE